MARKNPDHDSGCQFDFGQDEEILICRLNLDHRVILYKYWRARVLKEMLGLGILVGEAEEEARGLIQQVVPLWRRHFPGLQRG